MENPIQQNNQEQGLSVDHVKQLEGFLGTLMTNQEIIIAQNKELLSANKMKQIWGIVKVAFFVLITLGTMFYMPQIISKMTEQVSSSMNIGDVLNKTNNGNGLNITPDRISELENLLKNH